MGQNSKATALAQDVRAANREVRAAFAKARKIKRWVDEQPSGYARSLAERAQQRFGLGNVDDVRKLCLLADDGRGFRDKDVAELCKLALRERHVLRLTKLKRLLAVRHRSSRMSLARKMIRNDWSQAKTEAEIRIKNGGTGHQAAGGRRPRSPKSKRQLLDELEKIATR